MKVISPSSDLMSSKAANDLPPRTQNRAIASSFLKGLDLMTVLARRPEGISMSILVRKLNLPRTSILRMLNTLQGYGLVAKSGRVWCATNQFYEWCSRDTQTELTLRYQGTIRAVAAEIGELVELGIGEASGVRFIYWNQRDESGTLDPLKSGIHPLHRTAAGKLVLSLRPNSVVDPSTPKLLDELAEARATGIAWNLRESDPNVVAVATWAGAPSMATPIICIKWPFYRFTPEKAQRGLAIVRSELARLNCA